MLNFIYYPVSAIVRFWHEAFGAVLGPSSGLGWALAVVFLAFTRSALLVKPSIRGARIKRRNEKLAPQLQQLASTYRHEPQTRIAQTRALYAQHGSKPLASCLVTLFFLIVMFSGFFGLLQVLWSFNRPFLSAEQNRQTANYAFSAADVQSLLDARLLGAPLSSSIIDSGELLSRYGDVSRWQVAAVAVPLTIIASILTHLAVKERLVRAWALAIHTRADASPYLVPLLMVALSPFLPVGVLLYWLSNNLWALFQQRLIAQRLDMGNPK